MLHLYKGKSIKSYENTFFRKVAKQLTEIFEQRNWEGFLIGMPVCKTREDLQIDCLLITNQQIIIIDFKNYNGVLQLPIEEKFETGLWKLNDVVEVKGGSSLNPYQQLKKQRIKLIHQLENKLQGFSRKTISTMVCFHEKINVIGRVPSKYKISFHITDPTNYQEHIIDIVDVLDDKNVNYLSDSNRTFFLEEVFDVAPYSFHERYDVLPEVQTEGYAIINERYDEAIQKFLCSDERIMVITGNTKSGKTSLIPRIREHAFQNAFVDTPVFAYSNRLRKKMLQHNPNLEEVESLFGTLYDFNQGIVDQFYKKTIPLKTAEERIEDEKILYIIDDSQLISNSVLDNEQLQFGSGMLLNDILQYIDLKTQLNSKVIFIGDKNKLSYGSKVENALNADYLKGLLVEMDVTSTIKELELDAQQDCSQIVNQCNQIAERICAKHFNDLRIQQNEHVHLCKNEEKLSLLQRVYTSPKTSKMVVYSNANANKINYWIKEKLLLNGDQLSAKDYIIFDTTIEANELQKEQHITNFERIDAGSFGEIVQVSYEKQMIKQVIVHSEKVNLTFLPAHIKLSNGNVIETYVFLNYLKSEKGEISSNEQIAYQIILDAYKQQLYEREPFEQSKEFQEMQANNDYVILNENGKNLYRQKRDKRKLTLYEKLYRQRLERKLLHPHSEYYKFLNAARIRYAWAMTVNKAMAYTFEQVFFDTNQEQRGKSNLDYFKWLYTGISIASSEVQLINWTAITPFIKTEFHEKESTIPEWVLLKSASECVPISKQLQLVLQKYLQDVAEVQNIVSQNYAEDITLLLGDRRLKLKFYYKKTGEVKFPHLLAGEQSDFGLVTALLRKGTLTKLDQFERLHILHDLAKQLNACGIDMGVPTLSDWKIILHFSTAEEECYVQLWYNRDGLITQFNVIHGDMNLYSRVKCAIDELITGESLQKV